MPFFMLQILICREVTRLRIAYAAGATFKKVDKTIGGLLGCRRKFSTIHKSLYDVLARVA